MLHRTKTTYFAITVVLLSVTTAVFADIPVIENISKNSYNVIRYVNRSSESELSLDNAKRIKSAVMANKLLDAGEN